MLVWHLLSFQVNAGHAPSPTDTIKDIGTILSCSCTYWAVMCMYMFIQSTSMYVLMTCCAWQANSRASTGCVLLDINLLTTDFIFSVKFTHFFSNRMYIFSSVRKFSVTSYWLWTVTGACRHDHVCSVLFWLITAVARRQHARRTCSVEHVTVQSPAGAGPRWWD